MCSKIDVLGEEARLSGVFLNTLETTIASAESSVSSLISDVVDMEDAPFVQAGKRLNKGLTKRKLSGHVTAEAPLSKKPHGSNSPEVSTPMKKDKVELQFIEAQRSVNPFLVQNFFNNLLKRDVKITAKRHRLIIEVETTNERESILGLSKVADYRVKVFASKVPITSKVVIKGVPETIDLEDIKRESGCLSAYRISKKVKGVIAPTTVVVLTFSRGKAPERIRLAYQSFRTQTFVAEPLRCYNCCGFGHRAKDCRNAVKCSLCAKGHDWKECPDRSKERKDRTRICASCNSSKHFTGDKKCPKFATSVKLNETVANKGVSYATALKMFIAEKKVTTTSQSSKTSDRPLVSEAAVSKEEEVPIVRTVELQRPNVTTDQPLVSKAAKKRNQKRTRAKKSPSPAVPVAVPAQPKKLGTGYAPVNNDGKINSVDAEKIKLHVLVRSVIDIVINIMANFSIDQLACGDVLRDSVDEICDRYIEVSQRVMLLPN